jgi:hypothetical protein
MSNLFGKSNADQNKYERQMSSGKVLKKKKKKAKTYVIASDGSSKLKGALHDLKIRRAKMKKAKAYKEKRNPSETNYRPKALSNDKKGIIRYI